LGKRQYLVIILVFTLLLTAGLDYAGRNMYHALGGGRKFYTFLLPDLNNGQVVFCGHIYTDYQAENFWDHQRAVLVQLLQTMRLALLKQILLSLKGRFEPLWSLFKLSEV
jgi:hypothetical protein